MLCLQVSGRSTWLLECKGLHGEDKFIFDKMIKIADYMLFIPAERKYPEKWLWMWYIGEQETSI